MFTDRKTSTTGLRLEFSLLGLNRASKTDVLAAGHFIFLRPLHFLATYIRMDGEVVLQSYHNGFVLSVHYTRNMLEATAFGMQSTRVVDEQMVYLRQQRFFNEEDVLESSDGTSMNGVLVQIAASAVGLESGSEHHPESSRAQSSTEKLPNRVHSNEVVEPQQHASNEALSSSQTQSVLPTAVVENKRYFFRLFKIARAYEEYILEKHEVGTGEMNRYHLSAVVKQAEWTVKKRRVRRAQRDTYQVLTDPSPLVFRKKYKVPLHERLEGWCLEVTSRCNGATDKFYHHGKTKCRSLVEVSKYILYSCKKKLRPVANKLPQEVQEADAVDAMMILASEPVRDINNQISNVNVPLPHDNCVSTVLPNADQIREDESAIVAMTDFRERENVTSQEIPSANIQDEDIINISPEIEMVDESVDYKEIFASLPDIEDL